MTALGECSGRAIGALADDAVEPHLAPLGDLAATNPGQVDRVLGRAELGRVAELGSRLPEFCELVCSAIEERAA